MSSSDDVIEYFKSFDSQLTDGFCKVFNEGSRDLAFLKAKNFYGDDDIRASVFTGLRMGLSPLTCVAFMTLLHLLIFDENTKLSDSLKKHIREKSRMHKALIKFYDPILQEYSGTNYFNDYMEISLEEKRQQ